MGFPQRSVVAPFIIGANTAATVALTGVSAAVVGITSLTVTLPFVLSVPALTTTTGVVTVSTINVQTVTDAFRTDLLTGKHAFGSSVIRIATTADAFKLALYFATASRGPGDLSYTSAGEVTGTGYSAGGVAVTNGTVPSTTSSIAYWTPSASAVFSGLTISTAFNCMVLYNDTSAAKLAVAVFVFGAQTITAGTFTVQFALNDSVTGLIRLT